MTKTEVDMHTHSYFSDGQISPTELAQRAKQAGLKAICLTDHDAYQGLSEFNKACDKLGIDTITGIEITSTYKNIDVHILGYGFDLNQEKIIKERLKGHWQMHNQRAKTIIEKLKKTGITHANFEEIWKHAQNKGPYLSRMRIAQFLSEKLNMTYQQIKKDFDRGGKFRVNYIKELLMTPIEVVKLIQVVGGKSVLAHPGEFSKRTTGDKNQSLSIFFELLDQLQKNGLFGLEAIYERHSPEQNEFYIQVAREKGLFITAGSDYHGIKGSSQKLGMVGMTYQDFQKFKEACQS